MRLPMVPLLVLLVAACHPQGSGEQIGAPTARAAIETFLAGARSQDMRAMSNVFGSENGLVRDDEDRREHEMRMLSLMCFLNHDDFRLLSETPGESRRFLVIELTRGRLQRQATFTAVVGPRNRWFVSSVPVDELQEFCRAPNAPPAAPRTTGTH